MNVITAQSVCFCSCGVFVFLSLAAVSEKGVSYVVLMHCQYWSVSFSAFMKMEGDNLYPGENETQHFCCVEHAAWDACSNCFSDNGFSLIKLACKQIKN